MDTYLVSTCAGTKPLIGEIKFLHAQRTALFLFFIVDELILLCLGHDGDVLDVTRWMRCEVGVSAP